MTEHLCPGCGASEGHCISVIRGGAIKCCPDCDHHADCRAAVARVRALCDGPRPTRDAWVYVDDLRDALDPPTESGVVDA